MTLSIEAALVLTFALILCAVLLTDHTALGVLYLLSLPASILLSKLPSETGLMKW